MQNNKLITIGGIDYQWDGSKLQEEIEEAKKKFRNNKKGKGGFWEDVEKETGLSRTTIRGWYRDHVPRNSNDILVLANYLGCNANLFLNPIAYSTEQLDEADLLEKVDIIKKKRKELHINIFFLHTYFVVICGHEISLAFVWQILNNKKIPSENLCNDILDLFAIVEYNSNYELIDSVNVCLSYEEMLTYKKNCHIYRTKMRQLGLNITFVFQYLRRVKGYKIDPIFIRAIMYGVCFPTDSFKKDLEKLLDQTAECTMRMLFPLTSDQMNYEEGKKNINPLYVCKKAIPIIYTRRNSIYERREYIKRIESYANNRNINLNEMRIHCLRDSNYDELKEAMDLIEAGYYDAILLYARGLCAYKSIENRFSQYAISHNIPIIYVEDQYYI